MNLPNYLSIFRIFLVPVFLCLIVNINENHAEFRAFAFAVFLLAIITDALDGAIARKFNQQTKLGMFLDPLADKLLLVCGLLSITFSHAFIIKPPTWMIILIVFRDLLIVVGLGVIYLFTMRFTTQPNWLGKVTTGSQMAMVLSILGKWPFASFIWYLTVLTTLLSLISYLRRGISLLTIPPHKIKP